MPRRHQVTQPQLLSTSGQTPSCCSTSTEDTDILLPKILRGPVQLHLSSPLTRHDGVSSPSFTVGHLPRQLTHRPPGIH